MGERQKAAPTRNICLNEGQALAAAEEASFTQRLSSLGEVARLLRFVFFGMLSLVAMFLVG